MRGEGKIFGVGAGGDSKTKGVPNPGDPTGMASAENEKSRFETIKDELRQGLFGGFYVLLRHSEQSTMVKFVLLYFLQLMQLLSYTFNEALGEVWRSPTIIQYISPVLSTFRMVYWLEFVSLDIYIIVYYVTIFFLFFIIINFIYVAYCFKQRKFPFTWPIPLLIYSCNLLVSFLFIPILELFLKFSACKTRASDGLLYHQVFTDLQCFTGIHILHVTLSYVMIAIFLGMCYVINSCLNETRLGKNNIAKMHSRSHLLMLIAKVVYVMAFTFFREEKESANQWFLSLCLFLGSASVFAHFLYQRPYFDAKTQRFLNLFNGLFLWANAVLLLSCILLFLPDFTGSLPLFLLGSPFVLVIVLGLKDERKAQLMINLLKLDCGESYRRYINYFLIIVELKEEDRDAAMTLKGYLNHHSEFCPLEDCPLRNFRRQMIKEARKGGDSAQIYGQFGPSLVQQASLMSGAQGMNIQVSGGNAPGKAQVTSLESPALLISQAKNLYMNGIRQYPECVGLKIDFAWFLLSKMINRRESLKELIQADKQGRPSFDEAFVIYRYRQLIEDELYDQVDGGAQGYSGGGSAAGMDYVAALNFENLFRALRSSIERSATLHYDFWNLLLDDSPDLSRLKQHGAKINASIQVVDFAWKKLNMQSIPTVKALRLYASFLIEILNDKEHGNEQLAKAKEQSISRVGNQLDNFNGGEGGLEDFGSFANDGTPCIFISGEQERMSLITQCNMSLCKVFGYQHKEDLIGKDVEVLMPKLYARTHRRFLEQAVQKPPDAITAKERQVFGKHATGYIFPIWLAIKPVPSFVTGRQFAATIKVEKSGINKNVGYLIIDKQKNLMEASASAIAMLDIDLQRFHKLKAYFDITQHLPSLFGGSYNLYSNKAGSHIDYAFPFFQQVQRDRKAEDSDSQQDIEASMHDGGGNTHGNDESQSNSQLKRGGSTLRVRELSLIDEEEDESQMLLNFSDRQDNTNNDFHAALKRKQSRMILETSESANQTGSHWNTHGSHYDYQIIPSSTRQATFQCNMLDIHFDTPGLEHQTPGYYIRLESLQDKQGGAGGAAGVGVIAKVNKMMKQGAFQFSYDTVNKRFTRELRDKDNKDIMIDRNYQQLRVFKEQWLQKLQAQDQEVDPAIGKIPVRLGTMTYLDYLNRVQAWQALGSPNDLQDYLEQQDEENEDQASEVDESEHQAAKALEKPPPKQMSLGNNSRHRQQSIQNNPNTNSYVQGKEFLKTEIERMITSLRRKQDCGHGVRTYRRVDPGVKSTQAPISLDQAGRYEEIQFQLAGLFTGRSSETFHEEEEVEMDEETQAKEKANKSSDSLKNTIKSRKAFQMALTDKTMPPAIKRLSRAANLLLICLITIAVIDYSTVFKQLKDTITNYQVISKQTIRMSELLKVGYNVRSLVLLNQDVLTNYQGYSTKGEYVASLKKGLQDSLNQLYQIQNEINLSPLTLSEPHRQLLEDKNVNLNFRIDPLLGTMKSLKFSLNEAMLQIQSSIFTLGNMPLKDFVAEDSTTGGAGSDDVFFIMQNVYNDFLTALRRSKTYYLTELVDRLDQKQELSLIIFLLSLVTLAVLIAVLIPVVASVNEHKSKVLSLFCDIEDSTVRRLSERCERFINKMQSEESEEVESNNDEMMVFNAESGFRNSSGVSEEEDEYGLTQSGTSDTNRTGPRKRARGMTKASKMFYVKFLVGMLIIEAYFSYQFSSVRDFAYSTKTIVQEMNVTATVPAYMWFTLDIQRELYYNPKKTVDGTGAFSQAKAQIYVMSQLTSQLDLQHIWNTEYLDDAYLAKFEHIMRQDLCPMQTYFPKVADDYPRCRQFSSGMANQGLNLILINYIKSLRLLLSFYKEQLNVTNNNYTQVRATILNSKEIFGIYLMQSVFTEPLMLQLSKALVGDIETSTNARIQRTLFLLIFFLVLLLLAYVAVWIPLINQLNGQINRTKLMLMIVPIEVLMRMKSVAKVLEGSQDLIDSGIGGSPSGGPSTKSSRSLKSRLSA